MLSCSVISDSFSPWAVACQSPLSMEFPRQEYWSELPFLPLEDLPNPAIKPAPSALAGRFFTTEPLGKPKILDWSGLSGSHDFGSSSSHFILTPENMEKYSEYSMRVSF